MADDPVKPDEIRVSVQRYAGKPTPTEYDPRKWGAMIGWLNKYCGTNELRHIVLGWLFAFPDQKFEPISSSTLTPQQKNGIAKWIGTWFNEDLQEWDTRATFPQECVNVLNAARYDYHKICGQLTMDLPFEVDGELAGVVSAPVSESWDPIPNDNGWCEWCGERPSVPGVPCESCELLGATPKDPVWDVEKNSDLPLPPMKKVTGVAV